MEGELGDAPTLPQGLTLFLVEGVAKEQDDAPSPFTPVPEDSPQPPSTKGIQCHPTHTGGARPRVPAQPSAHQSLPKTQLRLEEPDPINHPHRWIHAEMEKIIHPC